MGLTHSFADMTSSGDARAALDASMRAVNAYGHRRTILEQLTAGVIVLDAQGLQSDRPARTPHLHPCAYRQPLSSRPLGNTGEPAGPVAAEVQTSSPALKASTAI